MTYTNAPRPPRPLPGEGSGGGGFRYASFQHRLGAFALDGVFAFLTLGIGWLIWSIIVWGEGQTPGKKILKIRVLNSVNGRVASRGHMAIREGLLGWWFLFVWMFVFQVAPLFFLLVTIFINLAVVVGFVWKILEIVFYFTKNSRTLRDLWVKTAVINEA
jgi:uncharacterized RDD family membrane protein YckC